MKKLMPILTFILFISGCQFQKPDYLKIVTAPDLNKLMQQQDIFLVDVHTPQQQHIKGTDVFIPYDEVEKYQDKLPKDKNTAIYLYCKSGRMANAAAKSLHELGYTDLTNLEDGVNAWQKAGFAFQ
jgi:rhodanese-related sulfurtransferase